MNSPNWELQSSCTQNQNTFLVTIGIFTVVILVCFCTKRVIVGCKRTCGDFQTAEVASWNRTLVAHQFQTAEMANWNRTLVVEVPAGTTLPTELTPLASDAMEDSEKILRHYSSKHQILLVGEGDFSFSLCLASAFGSATNITATSLDSEDELSKKFMDAMDNVRKLKRFGCNVQHEVDVHTMNFDNSLSLRRYDRIVFNFPHAGSRFFGREFSSRAIKSHKVLVQGFLENAKEMLEENGEIHITHKTTYPFSYWKIKSLAKAEGLKLAKESRFKRSHYPGYTNKRGSGGRRSDGSFPIGACSTLMFSQRKQY